LLPQTTVCRFKCNRRPSHASTKIDRRDSGLTFSAALETGGVLVGDEVTITLELEFVKA